MKKSRLLTISLLLAALAVVVLLRPLHERIGAMVEVGARVVGAHPFAGALLFVVLSMISAMVAFFSTAAVVPVAVTAWGKAAALLLLWGGWWLGGALAYVIGRYLGRGVVMHFIDAARLARYEQQFSKIAGLPQVLLLQMALPSEVPGYVFGILRCRPAIYLTALAIAELPFAFGAVFLGESFVHGNLPLLITLGLAGIALCVKLGSYLETQLNAPPPPVKLSFQIRPQLNSGLSSEEVAERRQRFGPNVLPHVRKRRLGHVLAEQLFNIIVLLLASAAVIAWLTGDRLEAAAILVVLVLNALIGFATEWEAGRALDALRKQTQITARVRRDGRDQTIAAEELVVGDVVMLAAGDRVPADLRLLEASALRAEESALTGESESVFKSTESSSMLFLGTVVTSGRAVAIVVATGEQTELGKIGKLVIDVPEEQTPLQKKLDALGRRLAIIVIVIAAIVSIAGWLRGDGLWQTIEVGISLAVAAVPEALPAVTTFILAFGVLAMARRSAIVRRLTSVETLGSATVICSDKTGTLTMNRMTVTRVEPPSDRALEIAALCNDATRSSGDPTEIALVACAEERGIDVAALRARCPRVAEVPFDERAKRMLTIHRDGDQFLFALKGAPSVVLEACDEPPSIAAMNDALASEGLRVLAIAEKRAASADADRDHGYTFLALVGMLDPPRPGVEDAVATAKRAGIRVVMLTGDQRHTAEAIARTLGLDAEDVYARVSPEEKFRIVESLQSNGEIVAVTGDGVNDAPALKRANVGIAMGERGTEVAKEAADIVLADDNFATIVGAIESGRAIYANIRKFVHMMFSHNLGEVLAVFVAIIASKGLPLLPLQILWINLVTDVFPAFALALEPPGREIMNRPPRDPGESMLSKNFLLLIAWQGAMLASIVLAMYFFAVHHYGEGAHARTVALFALVGVEVGHTLNCRSRIRSAFDGLLRNRHVWFALGTVLLLQIAAVAVPPLRRILDLVVPAALDVALFAAAIVAPVVIVELQKMYVRRRRQ